MTPLTGSRTQIINIKVLNCPTQKLKIWDRNESNACDSFKPSALIIMDAEFLALACASNLHSLAHRWARPVKPLHMCSVRAAQRWLVLVAVSLASQTQPTPTRIAFSITHGKAIRAGVGWVWLARLMLGLLELQLERIGSYAVTVVLRQAMIIQL